MMKTIIPNEEDQELNRVSMNKKIILSLGGIVLCLCLFILSAWITIVNFMGSPSQKFSESYTSTSIRITSIDEEELNQAAIAAGIDEDKIDQLEQIEKEQIYYSDEDYRYFSSGINLTSHKENASLLSEEKGKELYASLLKAASAYNFAQVKEQVQRTLDDYDIGQTELNQSITAIYSDALSMILYSNVGKDEKETLLKTHQSPVSLAIDALYALPRRREVVTLDQTSLVPLAEEGVSILQVSLLDSKAQSKYQEFISAVGDVRNVYSVEMSLLDSEIIIEGIVIETNDRVNRLVGYYSEMDTGFLTVAERKSIGGDFE